LPLLFPTTSAEKKLRLENAWCFFCPPLRFPTTSTRRHLEKSRREKSCAHVRGFADFYQRFFSVRHPQKNPRYWSHINQGSQTRKTPTPGTPPPEIGHLCCARPTPRGDPCERVRRFFFSIKTESGTARGRRGPIPIDWVQGVACLHPDRPPNDVPRHRWRQFVLTSIRVAKLGKRLPRGPPPPRNRSSMLRSAYPPGGDLLDFLIPPKSP
jgi:hypothetical protein